MCHVHLRNYINHGAQPCPEAGQAIPAPNSEAGQAIPAPNPESGQAIPAPSRPFNPYKNPAPIREPAR